MFLQTDTVTRIPWAFGPLSAFRPSLCFQSLTSISQRSDRGRRPLCFRSAQSLPPCRRGAGCKVPGSCCPTLGAKRLRPPSRWSLHWPPGDPDLNGVVVSGNLAAGLLQDLLREFPSTTKLRWNMFIEFT